MSDAHPSFSGLMRYEKRFTLPKAALGFYDNEGRYRLESGLFRIFVGGSSRDVLEREICIRFS